MPSEKRVTLGLSARSVEALGLMPTAKTTGCRLLALAREICRVTQISGTISTSVQKKLLTSTAHLCC